MKMDQSLRGSLPQVAPTVPWQGKDGKRKGWKATIPGQRPMAAPAVAEGRLFLGGGFGSHDFYALDAATGHVAQQMEELPMRGRGAYGMTSIFMVQRLPTAGGPTCRHGPGRRPAA
jgi:hypothetical protein